MRNKLDDSFIEKGLRCLLSVERLNLAQNKFSQQAVDAALSILKEHPEHKMQSLNMGQNRIVERKNRKVLDEFKKVNVNIVLWLIEFDTVCFFVLIEWYFLWL